MCFIYGRSVGEHYCFGYTKLLKWWLCSGFPNGTIGNFTNGTIGSQWYHWLNNCTICLPMVPIGTIGRASGTNGITIGTNGFAF